MSCYIVKTKDGVFGSVDLISFLENKGSMQILREAASKARESASVFDKPVFPLDKKTVSKLNKTVVYDIDSQLAGLREPADDDEVTRQSVKTVFEYRGERIVRLSDLKLYSKYNKRERMAVLKVCSAIYVVIGKARKDSNSIVVLEA